MFGNRIQDFLRPILNREIVHAGSGVDHSLGSYHFMDIVILRICDDDYVFGEIQNIFFINEDVYLYCQELIVLEYSTHFHAHSVTNGDTF